MPGYANRTCAAKCPSMVHRTIGGHVAAGQKAAAKVAILGFGTVGSSVARILLEGPAAQELELTHVYNRNVARKRAAWVRESVIWTEDVDEVLDSGAEVIVELAGGLHPAGEWVRRALDAGKSVVTANKKLIAAHGVALHTLARQRGVQLFYGAAVAGGIPVIPGLQQGLAGERIERVEGILNGTCNYILSGMESGQEYGPMLAEAQARGYAEADPTEDVGGFDARAKLVILSRLALRADMPVEAVRCRAITRLTATDFDYARLLGCTVRQISRAELSPGGGVVAMVGPMLVPQRSPLAWSRGTENMVLVGGAFGLWLRSSLVRARRCGAPSAKWSRLTACWSRRWKWKYSKVNDFVRRFARLCKPAPHPVALRTLKRAS